MKPYPAYKDSGVEWLGQVPEGWEVRDLKHLCHVFPSNVDKHSHPDETPVQLCNYTDVYYNDRITASLNFMEATATDAEIAKFSLQVGDVIFTKDSETADDIGIAAIVSEELPGVVCGYHLSIARPNDAVDGRFIKAFFDSAAAKGYFAVSANGLTRVGLGQSAINNLQLAVPPLAEQQAIAGFLDRETAKIDGLIEEQRRLIALLAEKRQATISHAVTRGLYPSARLKPSGVDWLGDIPGGWEMRTISSLSSKITNGYVGPTRDILQDAGVRYIQSLHVKGNRITFERPYYVDETWSLQHEKSILRTQDVLIVQTGDIGQVAVVSEDFDGCNCHALIIVSPILSIVSGDWLSWVLCSAYGRASLLSIQTGALHPHLNCGNVKFLQIPVPPLDEQSQIISALSVELQELDALTETATSVIALLQERRAALISAAVTGKIDVRDLASVQEAA